MKLALLVLAVIALAHSSSQVTLEVAPGFEHPAVGSIVPFTVRLLNLESEHRQDVVLAIELWEGDALLDSKSETLVVETQAQLVRSVTLPSHPGAFDIRGRVQFSDGHSSEAHASVSTDAALSNWVVIGLTLIVIVLASALGSSRSKRFMERRRVRRQIRKMMKQQFQ